MKKKGILFDFNGTLFWDSHYHELAWNAMSEKLRGTPMSHEELTSKMHGRNNKQVIEMIFGHPIDDDYSRQLSEEKEASYRQMCLEHPESFKLAPGVIELLDELKKHGVPMNIASASIKPNIDFFVEHFQLGNWFDPDKIVYDDGSHENKISMFKTAAELIGIPVEDSVIVEDSVSGIQFGKAVHACVIALGDESKDEMFKKLGVDCIIRDFTEFDRSYLI